MEIILWICEDCGHSWEGNEHDCECPDCGSENIFDTLDDEEYNI